MNQSTGLTERQNQSLPEKQMRSLTVNQAQRLNEEQIQSLSDEQLCSLSNEQIQSLTGGPVKIACERLAAIAHTGLNKQQSYPQSVKEAMMGKKASGQSYYPEALYAMKKLAMADNGNQTAKLCLARMLLHGSKRTNQDKQMAVELLTETVRNMAIMSEEERAESALLLAQCFLHGDLFVFFT